MATPHAPITQIAATESQGFDPRRLARIKPKMQAYVDSGNFSGITTLLARRGKIIHFDHSGVRDKASQEPLDSSTIFRIYSMTKPIVSVALMMLYEEGRFSLKDPVSKFIPAFKKTKVYAGAGPVGLKLVDQDPEMTLHHLLTHTSGLSYG